jgi:hypothetical protein
MWAAEASPNTARFVCPLIHCDGPNISAQLAACASSWWPCGTQGPKRVRKGIIAYKCPTSHPSNLTNFHTSVVVGRFVSNDMDYTTPGSSKLILVSDQLELIVVYGMLNISQVLCWMNESSLSLSLSLTPTLSSSAQLVVQCIKHDMFGN